MYGFDKQFIYGFDKILKIDYLCRFVCRKMEAPTEESCKLCKGKEEVHDGICLTCENSWYEEIKNMSDCKCECCTPQLQMLSISDESNST